MNKPTVQVPVSLIEELRDAVGTAGGRAVAVQPALSAARAVAALLPQPNPNAESEESGVCHCGTPMADHTAWDNHSPVDMAYSTKGSYFHDQYVHVLKAWSMPRIEDMAPGTTFTWDGHRLMRMSATAQYAAVDDGGFLFDAASIDPSTIRDVTPPAVTS